MGDFPGNHGTVITLRSAPILKLKSSDLRLDRAMVIAAFCIVDPADVRRDDGTPIAVFKQPTFKDEMRGLLQVLTDKKIIMLLPAMFVAEMCLALVSSVNGKSHPPSKKKKKTPPVNKEPTPRPLLQPPHPLPQQPPLPIHHDPTPLALAWLMSHPRIPTRRLQGLAGSTLMGLTTLGATAGLLGWLATSPSTGLDWQDRGFAAGAVLHALFGGVYATFQICVQWTLGALSNEPARCARHAGAFKGTVSLGMCVAFVLDSEGVAYRAQAAAQLCAYAGGLASLLGVTACCVRETNYFLEEGVVVPRRVEQSAVVIAGVVADEEEGLGRQGAKEVKAKARSVRSLGGVVDG